MGLVGLPPLHGDRSIPDGESRKVRVTFGVPSEKFEDFLVGANLALGEATTTVGVWAKLVYGDDLHGIDLEEGELTARTIANQETVSQTVHWDGFMPLSGGANRHLAAWVLNESGGTRVFRLHAYRVRWI